MNHKKKRDTTILDIMYSPKNIGRDTVITLSCLVDAEISRAQRELNDAQVIGNSTSIAYRSQYLDRMKRLYAELTT